MSKVTIFTQYHMQPPHPRIIKEKEELINNNFEVEIIHSPKKKFRGLRYFLSFTMFNWKLINKYRKRKSEYDIVLIYDFALLPLAKYLKNRCNILIYETIDHNAKFTSYELIKRIKAIRFIEKPIIRFFEWKEKYLINRYIDKVIVNSSTLIDLFSTTKKPVILNYYCSPFEGYKLDRPTDPKPAFIYIGRVSFEKGLMEMLDFASLQNTPFYLVGPIDKKCEPELKKYKNVIHQEKISIEKLKSYLLNLSREYTLWGFSFIKAQNKSSQIQELNKDIDYLAAGIPIIGNSRPLTLEKIEQGAGILASDTNNLKLLTDYNTYQNMSDRAKAIYNEKYSNAQFKKQLQKVFITPG